MIITINNDDGTTSYDVNNINDDGVKQEATVIVQKVGNLQVIIEALDFASRTHRANLEELLKDRDEAIVETERARNDKGQFVGDDPETIEDESKVTKET
jgi:hypothetical protein|tara:strand:+ start:1110 stop:1406 length:297 start_codon:yes stop_codon:yes gene_type:complete